MARKVFFSFHYGDDVWRVNQIRNAWVVQGVEAAGFWDASIWQAKHNADDKALKEFLREELVGTTVTVVLIGQQTFQRPWVHHEIFESRRRGNGLMGIQLNSMKQPPASPTVEAIVRLLNPSYPESDESPGS
jgi:hypothetical protein